ncbi:MAG: right-handed parallel beta-helix repeat-containing protein [Methanophagales archaeon]|nr:right-handed parallel beta-helix repeat-containing protein [Methanophagales archaeon]
MRTEESIAIGILLTLFFLASTCTASTIYVPGDYTTIQAAVDAASQGDTIIVKDGTYTENINVDKSLTIRSENGPDSTIIQAEWPVFMVSADYVNISGFTVEGAFCGIDLYYADYCNISNNNCSNNKAGIYLRESNNNSISDNKCSSNNWAGISISDSNDNSISNNNCLNNGNGISLMNYSNNNSISNNNCLNNGDGISISDSNDNSISNNNCLNNDASSINLLNSNNSKLTGNIMLENGVCIGGYSLNHYRHEIDESNTVNGKSVFYGKDIEGGKVPDGVGQVILVNCMNIAIENQDLNNASMGVIIAFSSLISIKDNNCKGAGISLTHSNNSKLKGNVMVKNGIYIFGDSISEYTHEIDESNTVNGKPVYYWKDREGERVPDGAGQVILVNCSNVVVENQDLNNTSKGVIIAFSSFNTIKNNTCSSNNWHGISLRASSNNSISNNICSNNYEGIYLRTSNNNSISNNICSNNRYDGIILLDLKNNIISNNNCSSNRYGIELRRSDNNSISNNNYTSNNWAGISLDYSNNNLIYLNNFIDNFGNVNSYESTNAWNSTEKIAYTYSGNTYTRYLGNYWGDYNGRDSDEDGIGDPSYSIDGAADFYPLMKPWENYFA